MRCYTRYRAKSFAGCLWMSEAVVTYILVILLGFVFTSVTCELQGSRSIRSTQDQRPGEVKEEHTTPGLNTSPTVPALCRRNCSDNVTETKTGKLCESQDVFNMEGRCCINTTHNAESSTVMETVIGIDLQNCGIKEEEFATGIQNLSSLLVVSLEGNPMTNITSANFNSNNGLLYLSLPVNVTCPGGIDAWSQIEVNSAKTICLEELNPCHYQNLSCPTNSHCVQAGINQAECLCDVGYHGYKCLNKGTFPIIPYAVGLTVPTVILGLLLWLTQRRYVKPKTK